MGSLVITFLMGIILLVGGLTLFFKAQEKALGYAGAMVVSVGGVLVLWLITFFAAPDIMHNGEPRSGKMLSVGSYKVASVYVAGDNLTVGLEIEKSQRDGSGNSVKVDHLYFYQYKITDFASLNEKGTRLVVSESSVGFFWMVLE